MRIFASSFVKKKRIVSVHFVDGESCFFRVVDDSVTVFVLCVRRCWCDVRWLVLVLPSFHSGCVYYNNNRNNNRQ